jgi:protein-S-isoprenylcysteine O-methyltransferase Ste14
MYVAVVGILCSWAMLYHSRTLWLYAGVVAILFELRVRWFEEPWLERMDREGWHAYRARVSRWIGVRAWGSEE